MPQGVLVILGANRRIDLASDAAGSVIGEGEVMKRGFKNDVARGVAAANFDCRLDGTATGEMKEIYGAVGSLG